MIDIKHQIDPAVNTVRGEIVSFIQSPSDCYHQTTGDAPIIEGVTYGSDLRLFTNHAHIPAVLFGPGDVRLAHAANEYVEIDEVITTVKIIANMIVAWCGNSHE